MGGLDPKSLDPARVRKLSHPEPFTEMADCRRWGCLGLEEAAKISGEILTFEKILGRDGAAEVPGRNRNTQRGMDKLGISYRRQGKRN
jgi:hypothetical protein